MADNATTGPVELGADMDYAEHEKTYSLFLGLTKYIALITAALLIAMAFGFFTAAGFISSTILFILICAVGAYLLR
ncbi:MAG: aa3-type cytochrome c oxidase subunit IV [Hyphomicrobiales bacterium]|nr:MAG: aa3-type cytochrome c oxidase subunit IV [Hyphomicrobiales bacterium]